MTTFDKLASEDWLAAFSHYASFGEANPRLMYWVGVSTLAAVLGRKVWFDQDDYLWSPNFYILISGEQGMVRKSTSIDLGMDLLRYIDGVFTGPDETTWPAFAQHAQEATRKIKLSDGKELTTASVTLPLSEFGTFFRADDGAFISALTSLWDCRKAYHKTTKTAGDDYLENPWLNMIAGTTPQWIADNFTADMLGGGLLSRFIFLRGEMSKEDNLYPRRNAKMRGVTMARLEMRKTLINSLRELADIAGEVELTEEAYLWTEQWYEAIRNRIRSEGTASPEGGLLGRIHVHLHKLAIVIAASRRSLPTIGAGHMQEAWQHLQIVLEDARNVLGVVGQTKITSAARQIVTLLARAGPMETRKLFRLHFYQTMQWAQFEEAVECAVRAELVLEVKDVAKPLLMIRP